MNALTSAILESPLFGIVTCMLSLRAGMWVNRKLRTPIANPLLVAITLAVIFLWATGIPLDSFRLGGDVIAMLLPAATAVLATTIYREIEVLKKNFLPVVLGCFAGSLTSIVSVTLLCRLFKLDEVLTASLLPKSVTTPIAIEVSAAGGGLPAITVAAVLVTGVFGAVAGPLLIRVLHIKSPVAAGVALGSSSHAIGTTKALEIGDVQGAMSGVAIGISGLITVGISLFL